MCTYKVCVCAVVGAVWLMTARPAEAQAPAAGSIKGRVTFEAGGDPVHGATVVVVAARRTATTDEDGRFEIVNVAPGTYDVLAQREHFSAARQSVTVPAGQSVTVDFKLAVETRHEKVTVTGTATGIATAFDSFNALLSLDSFEIGKRIGATLADVLQDEPGIARRSFGPGSSRPVIRGFDGDRVLIMQDGVRTGDLSSQSGDHGVSIDPAGLSRIEVVKGPATLLYGSNAIGGVVNAVTPQDAFRANPFSGTTGGVNLDTGSANGQAGLAANVQRGRGPLLLFGGFTSRRTTDYDAPTGPIPNSATKLFTGEAGLGWTGNHAYFSVGGGAERNRYGVPFAGLLEGEPDAEIDINVQRQNLRVDFGGRNLSGGFADAVRVTANLLDYQHDEIETEDGAESLGTRFTNRVVTVRAEIEQKAGRRVGGRVGAELFTRAYEAIGEEALAPQTDQRSFAVFAYEEVKFDRSRLQFGGRFERNAYSADVARSFNGFSGSLGAYRELGASGAFVVNLTGASRAPALEELFNHGPHPGNLLFEVGNSDLELERTMGLDVSLRRRAGRVSGELNAFAYAIENFVFLDVTDEVEDGLRVANYTQGNSRFTGVEVAAHVRIVERATLDASMGYVNARLTGTNEPLPRIPPLHGRLGLNAQVGPISLNPEVVFYSRQNRVFRDESPTAGFASVNLTASWQKVTAHGTHMVTAQAYNLGNTTYRLHTSFIKDLAPEMGRGVKVSYSVRLF